MAWNTPKTWNVGDILTASDMNTYVRDNTAFLNAPPSARVYNDANISINNDTTTALTFNTERFDTDTIHNTSTNTNRLTCQTAGLYLIYGCVSWAANNAGSRSATIRLNGSTIIAVSSILNLGAADLPRNVLSTVYSLSASDYVELTAYQNSGGALNVLAVGNYSPEFGMTFLGTV
jgi:hypothetical protein